MVHGVGIDVDGPAAPPKLRRLVLRALTVAGVSAGAWLVMSMASTANAQSPVDDISAGLQGVSSSTHQVVGGIADAAGPAVDAAAQVAAPVAGAAAPAIEQLARTAAPVLSQAADEVAPAIEQAAAVTEPIVDHVATADVVKAAAPILDQVQDLTAPVLEAAAPVVQEALTITDSVAPITDTVDPVIDPVLNAVAPVLDPIGGISAAQIDPVVPVVGPSGTPAAALGTQIMSELSPHASSFLDVASTGIVEASGDRSGGGLPAIGAGFTENLLLLNAFGANSAAGEVAVVAPFNAQSVISQAVLPARSDVPALPGVPAPAGSPGCPGHSGSGSAGSGPSQMMAIAPAGPHAIPANLFATDGDHAAALLTRCDEPGSSPG